MLILTYSGIQYIVIVGQFGEFANNIVLLRMYIGYSNEIRVYNNNVCHININGVLYCVCVCVCVPTVHVSVRVFLSLSIFVFATDKRGN